MNAPKTTWFEFLVLFREFSGMPQYKRNCMPVESHGRYMLYIRDIHFYSDQLEEYVKEGK